MVEVVLHHVRQVMKVHQDLFHPSLGECIERNIEQRLVVDCQHALRGGVGEGSHSASDPGGKEEGLHSQPS